MIQQRSCDHHPAAGRRPRSACRGLLPTPACLAERRAGALHRATRMGCEEESNMLLIRDVFRCKPGKAGELARRFKQTVPSMESEDGFQNCRVLVDYVASYWTVVLQAEVEDLAKVEGHMKGYSSRPEVREAMEGYMELVEGGHREIY